MQNTTTTPRTPINQGTFLNFSGSNLSSPREQNSNLNTPTNMGRQRLEAARMRNADGREVRTPLVMPVDLLLDDSEILSLDIPSLDDDSTINTNRIFNIYKRCRPVLRPHHNNRDNNGGRPFGGNNNVASC